MTRRHSDQQLLDWQTQGAVLMPGFFRPEEIEPCAAAMETLYGNLRPADGRVRMDDHSEPFGRYSETQFRNFEDIPIAAEPALNLLGLHPALIAYAREALASPDVHLYQCHTWAKFTGDADYEQPFHCDFRNHTLTVPAESPAARSVTFMIYLTDVTAELGATGFVPFDLSDPVISRHDEIPPDQDAAIQSALHQLEQRAEGPAGSVFAYSLDVYHRGVNLTQEAGHRYTLSASYKAAGNDMIGYSAWPHSHTQPWHLVIDHASPDQLSCLGFPKPGDPFWTPRTLARVQARWPNWNAAPYTDALSDN